MHCCYSNIKRSNFKGDNVECNLLSRTQSTPAMEDLTGAVRLIAQVEQLLLIEGHLFVTHKPQRPPPIKLRPDQLRLPPSLALYPDVSLEQHLRDHDEEVAALKASIAATLDVTTKSAHVLLDTECAHLGAKCQGTGFEKLALPQKLVVLRRAQAKLDNADEETFAVIAVTAISSASGLPTDQQTYHLPTGISWLGMQQALRDMIAGTPVPRHGAWMYQLANDVTDKGVKPLATDGDYASMRKRLKTEKAASVLIWHQDLWEASQKARAVTREKANRPPPEDDSAEHDGWAVWDPWNGLGSFDDLTNMTYEELGGWYNGVHVEQQVMCEGSADGGRRVSTRPKPQGRLA